MWTALLLVFCWLIDLNNALSVCRSTDILCFVDATTITERPDDVRAFINQLILKGTSERSSLAVVLYGDIPSQTYRKDENIILIRSLDTLNFMKGRKYKQKMVDKKLDFGAFLDAKGKDENTRYVSLTNAFNIASEHNPTDLPQQIVVFESDESAVPDPETCQLLTQHTNNIHFITDDDKSSLNDCGQQTHRNISYSLDQVLNKMQIIYEFSCPTDMKVEDDDGAELGTLSLQKHTNYISTDALLSCDLSFNDEGQLSEASTMKVVDDLEDNMTFEIGEYLIVKKEDYDSLPEDCKYPIFKIVDIKRDASTPNILTLDVSTPSMYEYITDIKVDIEETKAHRMQSRYKEKGKPVNVNPNKKSEPQASSQKDAHAHVPSRRRLLTSTEIYIGSGLSWGVWDSSLNTNSPICGGAPAYCFNQKVDHSGSGANAIRLLCANGGIEKRSNDGPHGAWMQKTICCPQTEAQKTAGVIANFITSYAQKVEGEQGWLWDDTAINDVNFRCSDGTQIRSTNGGSYGSWSGWKACPDGQAIGAYNQRVEQDVGISDDTGLNDLKFYCYPLDSSKTYHGSADPNAGMSDPTGMIKLIDLDTGLKEIKYTITASSVPVSEGSLITIRGSLTMSIKYQLKFDFGVMLTFDWSYSIWDGFTVNEVSAIFTANFLFFASLDLQIQAWLQLTIPKVVYFERDTLVWLGWVPVLVTPYFQEDLILQSPKVGFEISMHYKYQVTAMKFGTKYTSANGWETINDPGTKTEESSFTPKLLSPWDSEKCELQLSVSGTLRIYVGAKFYKILAAFVYVDVKAANSLIVPSTCPGSGVTDKCTEEVMHAVLQNRISLTVGVGVSIKFDSKIFETISKYLGSALLTVPIPGLSDIELFKREFCFELSGILYPIHELFKGICCSSPAHSEKERLQIGYDTDKHYHEFDDRSYNVDDRFQIGYDVDDRSYEDGQHFKVEMMTRNKNNYTFMNIIVGLSVVIVVLSAFIGLLFIWMARDSAIGSPGKPVITFQ